MKPSDVAIVGSGLAGATLALALRQAEGVSLDVPVLDGAPGRRPSQDIRAYAIAAGTRRLLEATGIWQRVADRAQAVSAMDVSDGRLEDVVRPALVTFDGEALPGEPFAHFVEARHLIDAAAEALEEAGIGVSWGARVKGIDAGPHAAVLETGGGSVRARLVVGADGRNSAARRLAGIAQTGWPYRQAALVAIIAHEFEHEGRAVQHFLPGGPFARLPLPGNRSGIVWSLPEAEAKRLTELDRAGLEAEIGRAAGPETGDVRIEEGPFTHPLELGMARRFVANRVALVGDAAHRLHPLAGQGLNMGFRDVAALAEVIVEAARRGEDIGAVAVLERYERWRRFDTVQFAAVTDVLNRLFGSDRQGMRLVRDLGLGLVQRAPRIKRMLVGEAAGEAGTPPRLMTGAPV